MSAVLSVNHLAKSYGPQIVLQDISFVLNAGIHAGLVGANGTGKSTLLKIAAGVLEADSGKATIPSRIEVGYLPQQPPDIGDASIDDLLFQAIGQLRELESRLRDLERTMANPGLDVETLQRSIEAYGEYQERFERAGGYDLDYRIDIVFAGLRIDHLPRGREFRTLSGGEKSRTLLATLLLKSPQLLLLDEPTNHLDFGTIDWLEDYLGAFQGAILAVSHDRHFLNGTVSTIFEIDEHARTLKEYSGNYDDFQATKAFERVRWEASWLAQQDEIKELKRAIRISARQVSHNRAPRDGDKQAYEFFGGRVQGTISRNVRNFEERLKRIETDPIPEPPEHLKIQPRFDIEEPRGNEIIRLDGITKRFDGVPVLDDVSLVLGPRQRVIVVGPNGSGKTTLLNIVAGRLSPDSGIVGVANGVRLGYLDQDAGNPTSTRTVIETFRAGLIGYQDEFVRDLFRYGLFTLDDLEKQVRQLSTGQRRKLQIARLIAENSNVLLLDEPTNHLSFEILEEFERALAEFTGPILAVTHDRWFIQRFGAEIWHLRAGRLVRHTGAVEDLSLERRVPAGARDVR